MPDKLRPPLGRIAVAQRDVSGKYDKDDLLTFYNEHGGDLQNGPLFYCVKTTEAHRAELVSFTVSPSRPSRSIELMESLRASQYIQEAATTYPNLKFLQAAVSQPMLKGWFGAEASSILSGESVDWRVAKKVQNLPVVDENFKQEVIKEGTVQSFDGDSNMYIIEPSPPREGKIFPHAGVTAR